VKVLIQKAPYYFSGFCAFLLLLFAALVHQLYFMRQMHWEILGVFALPALIFLAAMLLHQRRQTSRGKQIALLCILSILFALLEICGMFFGLLLDADSRLTDPAGYAKAKRLATYSEEALAHFPKAIPDSARNVAMTEYAAFLQGTGCFTLKYDTTREEIDALREQYRDDCKKYAGIGESAGHDYPRDIARASGIRLKPMPPTPRSFYLTITRDTGNTIPIPVVSSSAPNTVK